MAYIYKTGRAALLEQIKRHASVIHGDVLDIGSGNFARYQHLFKFKTYTRMDIAAGPEINVVGKIESIPLKENSFDSIVCTQVIGDVFDLKSAFDEMYRVLRPGGVLLLTESLFDPLHDEPSDFWRFTSHSLNQLALTSGFCVDTVEPRGGYWSVKAQLSGRYWIERLGAQKRWFSRILSIILRISGGLAFYLDRIDKSRANSIFTHGYMLIAHKND